MIVLYTLDTLALARAFNAALMFGLCVGLCSGVLFALIVDVAMMISWLRTVWRGYR